MSDLPDDLSSFSMLDLFKAEAGTQKVVLNDGLLALEKGATPAQLEELMRAAHSLKGAARIVASTPPSASRTRWRTPSWPCSAARCRWRRSPSPACSTARISRRSSGASPRSPRCWWT